MHKGTGPGNLVVHRIHQHPVASGGHAQPSLLVRHLKNALHMSALRAVLPGLNGQNVPMTGPAMDFDSNTGEQERIAHSDQNLPGHAAGIVIVSAEAGHLSKQAGHPDLLTPVALAKNHFFLPDVAVFCQNLLEILHILFSFM